MYGLSCDIERCFSQIYSLYVIEDANQVHGAQVNGKCLGTFGDVGIFSSLQTKLLRW